MFNKQWLNNHRNQVCRVVLFSGVECSLLSQPSTRCKFKTSQETSFHLVGQINGFGVHLSKFGVVLLPVFIQKLFSNLSRKHKGSLMLLFKCTHILDKPQWKSAGVKSSSTGTLSLHLPFRPPCLAPTPGSQTPEWDRTALTNDAYNGDRNGAKLDATDLFHNVHQA